MEIIQNILKVLGSVFSVLAALYGFLLWREKRRRETLLKERLSVEQAQVFAAPQRGVLEAWRLFDFQRDVRIADIYVQEILHVVDPSKEKSRVLMPPTPEEDIRRQLSEGHDPEKRLVVIEGLAGSG